MWRVARSARTIRPFVQRRFNSSQRFDECGIPLNPTWSVNELLSSYPKPTLSPAALTRLHELSALIPPEEGTPEYNKLKSEMEELIKLVEAVRLVDTTGVQPSRHINHTPAEVQASSNQTASSEAPRGRDLLKHAARTLDGFYVVDSDKRRSQSS